MTTILLCTNDHRKKDTANMLNAFKNSSHSASFSSIHKRSVRFLEVTVADGHAETAISFFQTKYPETSAQNITEDFSNVVELVSKETPARQKKPSILEKIASSVSEVIDEVIPAPQTAQLINS